MILLHLLGFISFSIWQKFLLVKYKDPADGKNIKIAYICEKDFKRL